MIRLGRYDAPQKWELLCRYWRDRTSVPNVEVDRFGRSLIGELHSRAVYQGKLDLEEFLERALRAPPENSGIAKFAREAGCGRLRAAAHELIDIISQRGFDAPFDGGIPLGVVEQMRQAFLAASLRNLRWTDDVGEIPDLEVLRHASRVPFPIDAIRGKRRVLCLFCAHFYGRNDVIHVHDTAPGHVTLVDLNAPSIATMRQIYPAHWTYVAADYRDFLEDAAQRGRFYDLVVADEWPDMAREVAWDRLPALMQVCSETLIIDYFDEMIAELRVAPDDLGGLSRAVTERTGIPVSFAQMMPRTHGQAGLYWAVIRRAGSVIGLPPAEC